MKKLILFLFFAVIGIVSFAQSPITLTSGTTFTVPGCVYSIKVECWGGGGGGGGASGVTGELGGGGGGGGGAYACSTFAVIPGTNYTYSIGNGGAGGTANGSLGISTYFNSLAFLRANGGSGGIGTASSRAGGTGGLTSALGDIKFSGGNGGAGSASYSGGGGSSAGTGANGGNGAAPTAGVPQSGGAAGGVGRSNTGAGIAGANYGGGGGGAFSSSIGGTYSGGAGARGKIVITYTVETPFIVTSIADVNTCGTLRYAVNQANISAGADVITFDPTLNGSTISLNSPLALDSNITIDGDVGTNDDVPGILITAAIPDIDGMILWGDKNVLRHLVLSGFRRSISNDSRAISISGNENLIQGCYIGTDLTGNVAYAQPNAYGINFFNNASNNIIDGNVISNTYIGSTSGSAIYMRGLGITNNRIINNYIGTNRSGTVAIPNEMGVEIKRGTGNHIGEAGAGNLISGNTNSGVFFYPGNPSESVDGNFIQGNKIGTDITGNVALPNGGFGGIGLDNVSNTTIGGTTVGERNIISGNDSYGISIRVYQGLTYGNNLIENNYIGVAADGITALPNAREGISLDGEQNGIIKNNRIAYNLGGLSLNSSLNPPPNQAKNNIIQGNKIYANTGYGIQINDFNNAQLSVKPPRNLLLTGNVLSGKAAPNAPVYIFADSLNQGQLYLDKVVANASGAWSYTVVAGSVPSDLEYFTTMQDSSGQSSAFSTPLYNTINCTYVVTTTTDNGPGSLRQCVFCANNVPGSNLITFNASLDGQTIVLSEKLILKDDATIINTSGKTITLTPSSTYPDGALLEINANRSKVIGLDLSANGQNIDNAVEINGAQNRIQDSKVDGFAQIGISVEGAQDTIQNCTVINNDWFGIIVQGSDAVIRGSRIGVDDNGITPAPNFVGVMTYLSSGTKIGLSGTGNGNIISGNDSIGVILMGSNAVVQNNLIGTRVGGTGAVANDSAGIVLPNRLNFKNFVLFNNNIRDNSITQNVISGNKHGVVVKGALNTVIQNNIIGLNLAENARLPNTSNGIIINDAIGLDLVDNRISGNGGYGLLIKSDSNKTNNLKIENNYIGTNTTFVQGLGNSLGGIRIQNYAQGTVFGGGSTAKANYIGFNQGAGLTYSGLGVSQVNALYNFFFANQNKPVVISSGAQNGIARPTGLVLSSSILSGTSTAPNGSIIAIYADSLDEASGYVGQTTLSGGVWSYDLSAALPSLISAGYDSLRAIVRDLNNNTSEFSLGVALVAYVPPTQPVGNRGMYFDGVDDELKMPDNAVYRFSGNSPHTISMWVKVPFGITMDLFLKDKSALQIGAFITSDGKVAFIHDNNGIGWDVRTTVNAVINHNQWTHLAFVSNGTLNGKFIYINGLLQSTTVSGGSPNAYLSAGVSGPIRIGAAGYQAKAFNGQIDEVKIFNIARTQSDIQSDMGSTVSFQSGLVAYLDFEESTGNTAHDLTPNSSHGTLTNGPLWALRVTNTLDNGSIGSLRWAIKEANTDEDKDYIDFSIQQTDATKISTISTSGELTITNPVLLDGYSAYGSSANTNALALGNNAAIRVEVHATTDNKHGINLSNVNNSLIRGLSVYGVPDNGAHLDGINVVGNNNQIAGCYIGLTANGTASSNMNNIDINGNNNTLGYIGTTPLPADFNIVCNSEFQGIVVNVASSINAIQGNYIGVGPDGNTAQGNAQLAINNIGDKTSIINNVISGNASQFVIGVSGANAIIQGNLIGLGADGTTLVPNGNTAIELASGSKNALIGGHGVGEANSIAGNSGYGILIDGSGNTANLIKGNSIYGNTLGGISLINGGNNLKLAPVITSATTTSISGTCEAGDEVEVFNDSPISGTTNQGRTFLGKATVTGATWVYNTGSFTIGDRITATATDAVKGTSEFSSAKIVALPVLGAALDFDGENDVITIPAGKINLANQSFSVEFWANRRTDTDNDYVCGQGSIATNNGLSIGFQNNTEKAFRFSFYDNDLDYTSVSDLVLGKWQHWAVTYDANSKAQKIYLDGNLVANKISTSDYLGTGVFNIANTTWATNFFNGQIDEFRIWSRALCEAEIMNNKDCEKPANQNGLLAHYDFNQGIAGGNNSTITTTIDSSGNNNNGTLSSNFALNNTISNWVAPGKIVSGTACVPFVNPIISVAGNAINISNGDIIPSASDSTDFGINTIRHFNIKNTGNASLTISSVTSSNNTNFTTTLGSISVGATLATSLRVSFNSLVAGTFVDTIKIATNDCFNPVFKFVVQATAQKASKPCAFAGDKQVNLTWTPVNGATSYTVYYGMDSLGTLLTKTSATNSTTVTGLTNDLLYYFAVSADAGLRSKFDAAVPVVQSGSAIKLNSTSQSYVKIDGMVEVGISDFTVEFWSKESNSYVFSSRTTDYLGSGNWFNVRYDGFEAGDGGQAGGGMYLPAINPPVDTLWHHTALVRNGNKISIYIDGVFSNSITDPNTTVHNFDTGKKIYYVSAWPDATNYFNANVDELRFWSYARTPAQIYQYKDAPLTGAETGLIGLWHFDEPVGNTAYDATCNGNNGKWMNNPTVVVSKAMHPFKPTALTVAGSTLTWSTPNTAADVVSYTILKKGTTTFDSVATTLAATASYTLPVSCTDEYYKVYGIDGAGQKGVISDSILVTKPIDGGTGTWIWTGAISTDWFDACNWDVKCLPDGNSSVEIPGLTPFAPEIAGALKVARCKSLTIETPKNNAKLKVDKLSGASLEITH